MAYRMITSSIRGGVSRFYFMPIFAMALVGLFAFSGNPSVAAPTVLMDDSVATSTIALAPAIEMVRAEGGEAEPFLVKITSYNAVPEQTDHNPSITASGAYSNPEVVAARSVDLAGTLPFGTVIALERSADDSENCRFGAVEHLIGYRVIADSMHSRMRQKIDVLLDETDTVIVHGKATNPSIALGLCSGVSVRVVGKIDIKDMPTTQEELRKLVEGDTFAVLR